MDGAAPAVLAVISVGEARIGIADLVTKCRVCERDLFAAVVRCPYCGTRRVALANPQSPVSEPEPAVSAPIAPEISPEATSPPAVAPVAPTRKPPLWGLSKPHLAAIIVVVLLVAGLYVSELFGDNTARPRQTIIAGTDWQLLEVGAGARIVANGPFRLRSGPELYTIPLEAGVAVPPPIGGEALEVRAVNGTVTLTIAY